MVVSSCPPSLHWERHQRLRLRMAIGVVLCEFADTPASSISSSLPPRSQVFATSDGYEASHLFFPAVAVSGSIVYMKGYDFVGSSCVEVPVANPSHALGFFFIRLLSVHVLIVVCRIPPSWLLGFGTCVSLGLGPPCVGPLVVFGPVPCVSSLVPVLGPSGSFKRRQWCSDARVAQTAMSGVVPSSLISNSSRRL